MRTRSITSAFALVVAIGLTAPIGAQDLQLSIGGEPVPSGQLDAVKARCEELFAASNQAAVPATDATATPAANAPAAGASDDTVVTESTAEAPVEAVAETTAETAAGNMAADGEVTADATIDLAAITLEQCQEGGFKAAMP